jgi:hypothetical protein
VLEEVARLRIDVVVFLEPQLPEHDLVRELLRREGSTGTKGDLRIIGIST